jgi:hypothetical protein
MRGLNASDDLSAYLEWAIAGGEAGFGEGDIISVTALAKGVGMSRNTAGKSVEGLAAKGMLLQPRPKSPYQIVSVKPIFTDAGVVADEQISLTMKSDSPSLISPMGECGLPLPVGRAGRDSMARLLRRELEASRDPLVGEAARQYWCRGRFQYYLRLRTAEVAGRVAGALLEATFLHLPAPAAEVFRTGIASLRDHRVTQISLYPLLEQCGLSDLRSGRSHATVACPPALLLASLDRSVDTAGVDLTAFRDGRPLLKWTYGIFHPEANPMITFSVCFVHADVMGVFIRNLDVELGRR